MKKNKLLVLSLLACTLLASCDEEDLLINGSNPVGNVDAADKNNSDVSLDTVLTLQDLYDNLKTSQGGTKAIEVLLEKVDVDTGAVLTSEAHFNLDEGEKTQTTIIPYSFIGVFSCFLRNWRFCSNMFSILTPFNSPSCKA